jgi:hypothetical protein
MSKFGEELIESLQQAAKHALGRPKGDLTGEALIAAMQDSPHRDVDVEPGRRSMRVRKVTW